MLTDIQILPSDKIDKSRWDNCVLTDSRAKCYSLSAFLDQLSDHWMGVVIRDYEAVVPLPYKYLGIKMLYTPPFIQHLDIAGRYSAANVNNIWQVIYQQFKLGHYKCSQSLIGTHTDVQRRLNLIIDLNQPYEVIQQRYTKACKRNLAKSNADFTILECDDIALLLSFYQQAYGHLAGYKPKHYQRLTRLLHALQQLEQLKIYTITIANEIVFVGALVDDGKRLYYLMGAPNEAGRKARITYVFIDYILRKFAQTNYIFDFEGSEIESVATFYNAFSPVEEYYYTKRFNHLPSFLQPITNKIL